MINRTLIFWCSVFGLSLVILFALSEAILPFIIGFIFAYLLNPLVTNLKTYKIPRAISAVLLIILLILAVFILAIALYGPVIDQINQLIRALPSLLLTIQKVLSNVDPDWFHSLTEQTKNENNNQDLISVMIEQRRLHFRELATGSKNAISTLYNSGLAVVDTTVMLFFLAPVIAAYLLADWPKVVNAIQNNLPRDHQEELMKLWKQIDDAISGFIRGQSAVCFSLATFYAISLTLVGLPFGIVIGLFAGLLTFIPFVGAIGGFLVAMFVGLTAFWDDWFALINLVLVFVVGQILESYVLTPKLVGNRVALHPVWLMFSLSAFGYLFGFIGLLVAVPISASIAVLIRYGFMQYRSSDFYKKSLASENS